MGEVTNGEKEVSLKIMGSDLVLYIEGKQSIIKSESSCWTIGK
jgi:hypothetical protein